MQSSALLSLWMLVTIHWRLSGLGTQQPGAPTLRGHAASQRRRSTGTSTNHLRGRFGTVCLGTSVGAQLVKNPPAKRETWVRSLSGEDPPGGGKGYPLQDSGLGTSMDYAVYGVAKSRPRAGDFHTHTHTPGTQVGTTCVLTPQAGQAVSPRAEDGFPRPKGQRVSGFGQSDLSAGKGPECFQQPEGLSPPLGQQPSYVHGAVPPLVWAERKAHEIAGQSKEVGFLSAKGRPHPGGREPGPPTLTPNREQHSRC